MDLRATRMRRHLVAALLAVAALALAATAGPAAAEVVAPPPNEAITTEAQPTRLGFTSRSIDLVGPRALVDVKCAGPGGCVGTLALRIPGGNREVAYCLGSGERQTLVVPLGSDQRYFDGAQVAHAVAQTMQSTGSSVRTARLLRVR